MCMIDCLDSDWVNLEPPHEVRARKDHKCSNCWRVVEAGEHYWTGTWTADGSIEVVKYCPHCFLAAGWLTAVCSGFVWGDQMVTEDLTEHWDESWEFQCRSLALLLSFMRRGWRTKQGDPISLAKARSLSKSATAHALRVMSKT